MPKVKVTENENVKIVFPHNCAKSASIYVKLRDQNDQRSIVGLHISQIHVTSKNASFCDNL